MKLLFDENLSFKLCALLSDLFPDSSQVRLLGLDHADDRAVWQYAGDNGFTIVSLDSDFAEMAALYGPPPKVTWLRCGNQPTAVIEAVIRYHAAAIGQIAHDHTVACLEIFRPSI